MLIEITKEQKLKAIEHTMAALARENEKVVCPQPSCPELDFQLWCLARAETPNRKSWNDDMDQQLDFAVRAVVRDYQRLTGANVIHEGFVDHPEFYAMSGIEQVRIRLLKLEQFRCHLLYRSQP